MFSSLYVFIQLGFSPLLYLYYTIQFLICQYLFDKFIVWYLDVLRLNAPYEKRRLPALSLS